eukprot:6148163-Ditylum_brightwellii.AAC.1
MEVSQDNNRDSFWGGVDVGARPADSGGDCAMPSSISWVSSTTSGSVGELLVFWRGLFAVDMCRVVVVVSGFPFPRVRLFAEEALHAEGCLQQLIYVISLYAPGTFAYFQGRSGPY